MSKLITKSRARQTQAQPSADNAATKFLEKPHFSFYKNRYRFLTISAVLLLIGILASIIFGIKLDIQFRGGTILQYSYEGEISSDKAEELLSKHLELPLTVQNTSEFATGKKNLVVNIAGDKQLSPEQQAELRTALAEAYPDQNIQVGEVQTVAPFIGAELLQRALLAVGVASLIIVAYVWFRFRGISGPSAGVFALLCLLHDVLLAFFTFIVMRIALNDSVVAVVLSILGWSVNDTIVIYDRIRENSRLYRHQMTLPDLVDLSIHQSLRRSIATSACAFLAVGVAYVFALLYNIHSIQEFALPMMVGIVVGSYSSIVVAAPFWAMWKVRKGRSGYER